MKWFVFFTALLFKPNLMASAYELKIVFPKGYSKPLMVVSANGVAMKDIKKAHLHFHGWTQDQKTGIAYNPKYDFDWVDSEKYPSEKDLKSFIEAYSMQREVERDPSTIIIIPLARGNCDQYSELSDVTHFDSIISEMVTILGLDLNVFKIQQASAHSGGGEVLSKILELSTKSIFLSKVSRAVYYDAIYSESTRGRIQSWILNHSEDQLKKLDLISIPNQTPSNFGDLVFSSINNTEASKIFQVNNVPVHQKTKVMLSGDEVSVIQEKSTSSLHFNHWSLVTEMWMF